MHAGPWVLFLGMVLVVGGFPLWFATMRPPLRTNLLYGHLGLLQLLRGFLSVTYVIPLWDGLDMAPGNVLYTAIMMTAVLLVLVERRTAVLRSVILVLLATEAVELLALATTSWALGATDVVNVTGIDPSVFRDLLRFTAMGSVLLVVELVAVVAVLEQVRRRTGRPLVLSLWSVAVFCLTVVADGALFPLLAMPFQPGLTHVIVGGVGRKVLLAAVFGAMLLVFVLARPNPMQRYLTTSLRLRDVLFAPRHRLIARLEQHEAERVELLERSLHVAEDERRRLAEDLHDDAIQLLTAADIHLQRIAAASPEVDVDHVRRLLRGGVGSLRRLILELRGPDVTATSFEPLVRAYVDRLLAAGPPTVELDVALASAVPEEVASGAFRIVLEALSNAVRHAEADHVTVSVAVHDGQLVGEVVDDGVGIPDDAETGPGHLGLRAMRDRVDVLGGHLEVRAVDVGTEVSFALPLEPPELSDPRRPAPSGPGRPPRT